MGTSKAAKQEKRAQAEKAAEYFLDTWERSYKRLHIKYARTSRSGMRRYYAVYIVSREDGGIYSPTHNIARMFGAALTDDRLLPVDGCGFCGANHIAQELARFVPNVYPHNTLPYSLL